MINKAMIFAVKSHKGQVRKGTQVPYIVHPMEVGAIVAGITSDPEMIAAAILHDTVEDCPQVTLDTIREEFGERVAELVESDSENKSDSWEKRKGDTIESLKKEKSLDKKLIALADKLSNIRSVQRDYEKLGDRLWERFNMKDKRMQGWYYHGVKDALSDLNGLREYREYAELVNQVFIEE